MHLFLSAFTSFYSITLSLLSNTTFQFILKKKQHMNVYSCKHIKCSNTNTLEIHTSKIRVQFYLCEIEERKKYYIYLFLTYFTSFSFITLSLFFNTTQQFILQNKININVYSFISIYILI